MYYEAAFQVGARDTDPFNQCRPSSMMDFLQETATGAAVELHVSREEMLQGYGVFWMLARIWYRLDVPVFWNDRLTVQTWHRGSSHGASIYRDFDIFRDGKPIGEGVSLWVLADIESRKLRRVSDLPEFNQTSGGDRCKSLTLPKLRMPVPLEKVAERRLWYSDCDVNGHVNNVHYADYALVCDNSRAGRNPVIRAFVDDDIVVLGIAGGLGYGGRDVSEIPYGVESGIRRNVPACLFPVQP